MNSKGKQKLGVAGQGWLVSETQPDPQDGPPGHRRLENSLDSHSDLPLITMATTSSLGPGT